ncbi:MULTISPECIES: hypothetical protein [Winogradskyella]|uniref:Uncharacterized protein n=1 Tax=Winogradskyella marincola TaxID=3037795 RepID=A0ABT6G1F7_9FLAO|nr:hypothetical protein [Winogradskyella sp. YYF002]MDG4715872.1 hypothetical protein [Winogradskyella sp. YYF002]
MNSIGNKIYNHDTDLDITHKINSMELTNWINHLQYIKKELSNFISICSKELNSKIESPVVIQRFKKKQKENDTLLNALLQYNGARAKIIECEDTECDMVYISEHESYRRSYIYHLDKYRRLKDEFFNSIKGKFTLLKMT